MLAYKDDSGIPLLPGVAHEGRRGDRRSRVKHLHLPERRNGFDRRCAHQLTRELRDQPLALIGILVLVNGLSMIDFAFTWGHMQAGIAAEANPLLATLFAEGPVPALLFKTAVMLTVSVVVWRNRQHRPMLGLALLSLGTYLALVAYHLLGPIMLT